MHVKVERRLGWLALGLVAALLLALANGDGVQNPTATRETATARPTAEEAEPAVASDEFEGPEGGTILTEDDRSSRLRALTNSWALPLLRG